jgi:hypothetical protein
MTFTRTVFAPTDLSPAEIVHATTYATNGVNTSDTLESYKREREERAHAKRVAAMRTVGFGRRVGYCG